MKYILRSFAFLLVFCSFVLAVHAQERKSRDERIEKFQTMKIAFLTEKLELTTEEAEKFWPLYKEFETNKREISRHRHFRRGNWDEQLENMTDQEAQEMLDEMMAARKKEVQLDEAFHKDLNGILPPKKILKLHRAEIQFREHMLRKLRDERRGGSGGSGSPGGQRGKNPSSGPLLP
jgi:hypothetical protein